MNNQLLTRRRFIKNSSLAVGAMPLVSGMGSKVLAQAVSGVSIVTPTSDNIVNGTSGQWAVSELKSMLEAKSVTVTLATNITAVPTNNIIIVVEANSGSLAGLSASAEAFGIGSGSFEGRSAIIATGSDARGLVYAVLELKDRAQYSTSVGEALNITTPIFERPHNVIRSMNLQFVSETGDKPWFNNKEYWREYFTLMATNRINRVNLGLGMGYNFSNPAMNAGDAYFAFAYPFFVAVDGVTVSDLPAAERTANLAMLKWISDEAAKREVHFQLGLWCHSNKFKSPKYKIQKINSETLAGPAHAEYCRKALAAVMQACPNIKGVTFRTHWESGIPIGSFAFWKTVYSAFTPLINAGRKIEIDMHGKEVKAGDVEASIASGADVIITPKRWFEFWGIPYHQAFIRDKEQYTGNDSDELGHASRYGYSNYFRENRQFGILHRIWPGTTKLLLWADPLYAAAYGRNSSFCGSLGIEWCGPLSFKGRQGSAQAGSRCGYKDNTLTPTHDFQKFDYTFRIWGRLLYNPDTNPDTWRRYLRTSFGGGAQNVEEAIGAASRVNLIVTTMHMAAPGAQKFWPECYINYSIVQGGPVYQDSSNPLRETSSGDPQLIMEVGEHAEALVSGSIDKAHKYTPIDFCQLLEDTCAHAESNIDSASSLVTNSSGAEFKRLEIDAKIQLNNGFFFANKFRSAVLWSIYQKTNDNNAKTKAVEYYEKALDYWKVLANLGSVYQDNLAFGDVAVYIKGHWKDRTQAIQNDINAMKAKSFNSKTAITTKLGPAPSAITAATSKPTKTATADKHTQLVDFNPGSGLTLTLAGDAKTTAVRLYYRHVSHAVSWESKPMTKSGSNYTANIPGNYTNSDYPLQYYFGVDKGSDQSIVFPGFDENFTNQPYYVVRAKGFAVGVDKLSTHQLKNALSGLKANQVGRQIEVQYKLSRGSDVSASLYDLMGRKVGSYKQEHQKAGLQKIGLKASVGRVSPGQYVVQVIADGAQSNKRIKLN